MQNEMPESDIINNTSDRPERTRRRGARHWAFLLQDLLLFSLFFLYLWLVIKPHLIFHGSDRIANFPPFYTTWSFFIYHLRRLGGPVEYVSAFLSQLFYYSWAGALVITAQAWTFRSLIARLVATMNLATLHLVGHAPALLLLIMYGRYTYFFPTTMALLVALLQAYVYMCLGARRTPAAAAASFTGLAFACYYAAGAAMLLFAATCVIRETFVCGRRRLGVLYALIALGLPYVLGVGVFRTSVVNAYSDLLPISWKILFYDARRRGVGTVCILYLLAPVTMVGGGIVSILWRRWETSQQAGKAKEGRTATGTRVGRWAATLSQRFQPSVWGYVASTVGLVAVGAAVACGSLDARQKTRLAVDYFAYHGRWTELLVEGRKACDDPFVMHAVNRALYHTGRLGDAMFAWPQDPTYLFLTDSKYRWVHWQCFATHLELGAINVAENALMECLGGMGERPMVLQQLAWINLAKGNLGTARVFLHTLRGTLFHRQWAHRYLALLERDPGLATDRDIQYLRSVAMEQDYPSLRLAQEGMLLDLLKKNSKNRMASEYLMASYLLNRQLSRFIERIDELPGLGYQTLPRHYEEAVLVYAATARTSVQLRRYSPRNDVRQQMKHFLGILQSHGGDKQAAFAELERSHGNTYAFYNIYGRRGTSR